MTDHSINLSISASGVGAAKIFTYHLRLGDSLLASHQALTPEESKRTLDLSERYGALFEGSRMPQATSEALAEIGSELFSTWLGRHWAELTAGSVVGASRNLLISSADADILNLPWELLRPPGGDAIGVDGKWSLRRLPLTDGRLSPAIVNLPAGPLRVLHIVSAPTDQPDLDYEKEEELLLRSLSKAGSDVVFDSGDQGSFEELEERISDFKPHIVHLTGHGVAEADCGYFAFEDEHGRTDLRAAHEIGQLFAGQGVQCAFISACQAGKAPSRGAQSGLAQGLLAEGVPLVIGWSASILDDVAIELSARFYREVANGHTTVDRALISARLNARRVFADRADPSWSLPVLYSATMQNLLFDCSRIEARQRSSLRLEALPGMSEEGFTAHFIGRRREVQQLLPALRSGETQVVVLTGLGGAGKSTLATRLARKLEAAGWHPVALSSSNEVPLTAAMLLEIAGDALLAAGMESPHAQLRNPSLSTAERLRLLVNSLNEHKFLLLIDNFESNLDEASRAIIDSEISGFYRYLMERMRGKSRAIVTSRLLPSDAALPLVAREWQLDEFAETAFLKFLLRDQTVERRYRCGELPHELIVRLHRTLGGTPRFLVQIRTLLETMSAAELEAELNAVAFSNLLEKEPPGALRAARDSYCEKIFAARLYGLLSPKAQQLVRRLAVTPLALPLDGLAAIGDLSEDEANSAAEAATRLALLHRRPGQQPLWSVYGTLRTWLLSTERTSLEERRLAHLAAGNYLGIVDDQNRESEIGATFMACRQERRAQYIAAGEWNLAQYATSLLSKNYQMRGLYESVIRINLEILSNKETCQGLAWMGAAHFHIGDYKVSEDYYIRALSVAEKDLVDDIQSVALHQLAAIDMIKGEHQQAREKLSRSLEIEERMDNPSGQADAWHQLATIDMDEGDYVAARANFNKSLSIKAASQDWEGVAAAFHQLASIDLEEELYREAHDKLIKSLEIVQKYVDPVSEAAIWHQLGAIMIAKGKLELGLKLMSLCWIIDSTTHHRDRVNDAQTVTFIATALKYSPEALRAILMEVSRTYTADRGASLVDAIAKAMEEETLREK